MVAFTAFLAKMHDFDTMLHFCQKGSESDHLGAHDLWEKVSRSFLDVKYTLDLDFEVPGTSKASLYLVLKLYSHYNHFVRL